MLLNRHVLKQHFYFWRIKGFTFAGLWNGSDVLSLTVNQEILNPL